MSRVSEEGLSRARERSNSHHLAWAHVGAGNTHLFARNAAEAARHGAEAMAIAREQRPPQWLAFGAESRGWGLCHLGAIEEGLALLEESLYRLHGTGARLHTTRIHGLLAECCLLAGRLEAASEHLRAARQHAADFGERYMAAELHRLSAALLQAQGAPRRAVEAELRKARRTAAAQGARLLELRATVALARLQDEQGAGGAMRRLLAQCCRQCSEGRELPDLQEATALLEKLARCSGAAQHHSSS